jgi:CBS domain-containing protein
MLCGMQEIARFLAAHKPFDGLAPEALEQTAATVEIAYFPRGASILQQGGEPSRHLYVIVKGTVELRQVDERGASELVETLAQGETFGQVSLLSRSPHLWDVVARDDVLAYLIPAEQVERLRHQPGFEDCWPAAPATACATPWPSTGSWRPWTCSRCAPTSWSGGR